MAYSLGSWNASQPHVRANRFQIDQTHVSGFARRLRQQVVQLQKLIGEGASFAQRVGAEHAVVHRQEGEKQDIRLCAMLNARPFRADFLNFRLGERAAARPAACARSVVQLFGAVVEEHGFGIEGIKIRCPRPSAARRSGRSRLRIRAAADSFPARSREWPWPAAAWRSRPAGQSACPSGVSGVRAQFFFNCR